jgi:NTE family protein
VNRRRSSSAAACFPLLVALTAVVLAAPPASADTPRRPRVALALGGGSAKGIAHVGVLKWLEEHHIPVDFVAGTSMGGLIGGTYAVGMSPAEIEELLAGVDWDLIFRPDAPYRLKGYRRKEDALHFPVDLELGLKHGFSLPSGLNSGHHIGVLLSSIALPYSTVTDFDDLPVPFRCAAVDMKTAEVVALGDGSLGTALRATMAIPAYFDPVHLEGRVLSDGGVLNNVPVDVARDMGGDMVIAVKVGRLPDEVSETILGLANQAISVMMEDLTAPRLDEADLVILPDLGDLTGADYRSSSELVQAGYDAVAHHADALLELSVGEEEWQDHLAERRARMRPRPKEIAFTRVTGIPDRGARRLTRALDRRLGGALDEDVLARQLSRLIGTGRYAAAAYGLVEDGDRRGLQVSVLEKGHAPPFVNFAADITNEGEDISFNFAARATFVDVTTYGSELRIDGSVGRTLGIGAGLFQPLGSRGLFASLQGGHTRVNENLYEDDQLVGVFREERSPVGVDLGWLFDAGELRLGYETAHLRVEPRVGLPEATATSGQERLLRTRMVADTRDASYFPRGGVRADATFGWFFEAVDAKKQFGRLNAALGVPFRGPGWDRGQVRIEVDTLVGPEAPRFYAPSLGGPFRLSAFGIAEFRGRHAVLGHALYLRSLARLPDTVGDRLYLLGMLEVGSAFEEWNDAQAEVSGTAGVALDSFLGPGVIGVSFGTGGAFRFFFTLGRLIR